MKCEKCIHYGICVVNSYCHEPCGYYEEERPHGEWKWRETSRDDHFRYGDIYCGVCGYVRHQVKPQMCLNVALYRHPVCENCGADMRGEGESE